MNGRLYHFEIGFPRNLNVRFGTLRLRYSHHARQAALNDRYGDIDLPEALNTNTAKVIEVEVIGDRVEKVLYRVSYNDDFDLLVAVMPRDSFVKTVWLNRRNDGHKTLNAAKYNRP